MRTQIVADGSPTKPATDPWRPSRETAPSVMRSEDPTLARWFGLVGLMLLTLGSVALGAMGLGYASRISPVWGSCFLISGLALLLFHAAVETDSQLRRIYGVLGYLWLAAAILLTVLPIKGPPGTQFLPYGYTALGLALFFLLAYTRNEVEESWRRVAVSVFGIVGIILALTGFIGGNLSENFLLGTDQRAPYGLLLIVMGLPYLWAFVALRGTDTPVGYRASLGMAALGAIILLIALGRSVVPPLFHTFGWLGTRPQPYFVPTGLVLSALGFLYFAVAGVMFSDRQLIVLFRRELASFFYSPIAYFVLFSFVIVSFILFWQFAGELARSAIRTDAIQEPIITGYLLAWFPIICLLVAVPVITMRLLSEEHRTGTYEVLLTAPVSETPVVLSKFLAALVFFMLTWVPWGLYLIALRVVGGQPFEYRPLLTFFLMVACTGSSFLSMGLFFSSLTRNQVISAVLTFMGMLVFTLAFFAKRLIEDQQGASATMTNLIPFLTHVNYLDLWITSLFGEITPKYYVFHLSAAVFWLFLTVKVMESRRWR